MEERFNVFDKNYAEALYEAVSNSVFAVGDGRLLNNLFQAI